MSLPFLRTLQGDRFFQLLILVGIGLSFFVPFAPKSWPAAIDWHTIITLSGLMLLTKGVELSGYFDVLGRKNGAPLCYGASAGDVYGTGGGAAFYLSDQRCRAVYCCSADYHAKKTV